MRSVYTEYTLRYLLFIRQNIRKFEICFPQDNMDKKTLNQKILSNKNSKWVQLLCTLGSSK